MKDYEAAFLERLETEGNSPGWKPCGRNEKGEAMMKATSPREDGTVIATYLTIQEKFTIFAYPVIETTEGEFVRTAKLTVTKEHHKYNEYNWS